MGTFGFWKGISNQSSQRKAMSIPEVPGTWTCGFMFSLSHFETPMIIRLIFTINKHNKGVDGDNMIVWLYDYDLPKDKGREGGEKSACSAPAGAGARTQDLPRARRGSPAARHGGCLDKQPFPCVQIGQAL